jgi:hypothetical protein
MAYQEEVKNVEHLATISEDLLFRKFFHVLHQPCTTAPFKDFNVEHRDCLMRMRLRAIAQVINNGAQP